MSLTESFDEGYNMTTDDQLSSFSQLGLAFIIPIKSMLNYGTLLIIYVIYWRNLLSKISRFIIGLDQAS